MNEPGQDLHRLVTIRVLDNEHCHPDCPLMGFEDGITGADEQCCGEPLKSEPLKVGVWPTKRFRTEDCKRLATPPNNGPITKQ